MFEKKHRYIAVLKNIDSIDSDIDVFASLRKTIYEKSQHILALLVMLPAIDPNPQIQCDEDHKTA